MKASCVICSDLYDQNVDIGSLPCGHVYHMHCINKWMDHCHSCPECRHKFTKRNVNKLYFHYHEPEVLSLCSLENDISNLKVQLAEKSLALESQKTNNEQLREFVRIAEENAAECKQKYLSCDSRRKLLELKVADMDKLHRKIRNLEDEKCQLGENVKQFKLIESAIFGTRQEVDELLRTYCGPNANKDLATCCSILKREIMCLTESKQTMKTKLATQQKEMREMSAQLSKLESANKAAQNKMLQLEAEKTVLSQKCSAVEAEKATLSQKRSAVLTVLEDTPESPSRSSVDGKRPLSPDTEVLQVLSKTPVVNQVHAGPKKKIKVNIPPFERIIKFPLNDAENWSRNSTVQGLPLSVTLSSEKNDSVTRTGYNGFGGHTKFICRRVGVNRRNPLTQKNLKS